jgi:hypothetical protein
MRDKHLNSDYVEFLRMASKCNEYHSRAYSNLCSEIELPNSGGEITFKKNKKPQEPEEDNTALLLM